MAEAEQPERLRPQHEVTVDDVRQLMGASTPHFALQLRNRIRKLIAPLPPEDPARELGEQEIARLERLGVQRRDARRGLPGRPAPAALAGGLEPGRVAPPARSTRGWRREGIGAERSADSATRRDPERTVARRAPLPHPAGRAPSGHAQLRLAELTLTGATSRPAA